jgi:hypothetical protein
MQKFDYNIFFEKNDNYFAENCQKSQKIFIVTSTSDGVPLFYGNIFIDYFLTKMQIWTPIDRSASDLTGFTLSA